MFLWVQRSVKKVMLRAFWDMKGFVIINFFMGAAASKECDAKSLLGHERIRYN